MPSFIYANQTESEVQKKERIFVEDAAPTDAELNGEWKLTEDPVFLRIKVNYADRAGKQPALLYTTQKIHTIVFQKTG